ncbi:hypothetical protein SAMN02927923_00402 [Microvirga guangxiensis]|uniref:Uncharacterized protein n=1 Tax=Microvirga guangxiensis TaxID=549386 RepID=A0A1G5C0K8_9HYPH|nr:hypothetical protein SAMN02927923_00402 [Microvirga guangxiensis]
MIMLVVVSMMMAASTAMTVLVLMAVVMLVIVGMAMMLMSVSMVMMVVIMPVPVMMVIMVADMGAALGLEGALHRRHGAALPARELRESRIVLDVESIVLDLGEAMIGAEVPGKTHETQGVLRLHFQQALGLRLHLNKAAVLQAQGIAVIDGGFHIEIDQDLDAAFSRQPRLPAAPRLMVEDHRVDDTVCLYGGLANDSGDAGHGFVSGQCWISDR